MSDGSTEREHLLVVERNGQHTGGLEKPPIPSDCHELLKAFWSIRRSAGSNGMTAAAISYSEITAWQALSDVQLDPFEVDLLFVMDNAALAAFAEKK
jgi:hypothetical protein